MLISKTGACPICKQEAQSFDEIRAPHQRQHIIELRKCVNNHTWKWFSNTDCEYCVGADTVVRLVRSKKFYGKDFD